MNGSASGLRWQLDQPQQLTFEDIIMVLELRVPVGRVNVIGTDGPATLEVHRVEGEPLRVDLAEGRLSVRQGTGSGFGLVDWFARGMRSQRAELSLGLPPDTNLEVKVIAGAVVVSNFHERVNVQGVSGEITLAGVHGRASVRTVSGVVTAEQVTGDLDAATVSGAITVLAGSGGDISLNTVAGTLTADLADPMPLAVNLRCVSGQLVVRLPHDPDTRVHLSTMHGPLTSAVAGLRNTGWALTGTLGAGASRLHGSTLSGPVTVLRRPVEDDFDDDIVLEDLVVADRVPDAGLPGERTDERNEDAR